MSSTLPPAVHVVGRSQLHSDKNNTPVLLHTQHDTPALLDVMRICRFLSAQAS